MALRSGMVPWWWCYWWWYRSWWCWSRWCWSRWWEWTPGGAGWGRGRPSAGAGLWRRLAGDGGGVPPAAAAKSAARSARENKQDKTAAHGRRRDQTPQGMALGVSDRGVLPLAAPLPLYPSSSTLSPLTSVYPTPWRPRRPTLTAARAPPHQDPSGRNQGGWSTGVRLDPLLTICHCPLTPPPSPTSPCVSVCNGSRAGPAVMWLAPP